MIEYVVEFANNVLREGRDRYHEVALPLFADGINVKTKEQTRWNVSNEKQPIMSNLASHQNLFRTFVALTMLTGDNKYKDAATSEIKYHFDNLLDESGLLSWGGHRFFDLETMEIVGPDDKGLVHELKNVLPYYDLMYEVDKDKTLSFIEAFWNAHVLDWKELYVGRHGEYGLKKGKLWDNAMVNLPIFRTSTGLSFLNVGNDLIYSAAKYYEYSGNIKALEWAKHLAHQYVRARNPETQLGAYQFTQPKKIYETDDDNKTLSFYGDRAKRQFGPEFEEEILEGKVLFGAMSSSLYTKNPLVSVSITNSIGEEAKEFLDWTVSGMEAFATWAYIPEENMFKPMFTDGTDMTNYDLKRDGYYGKKGRVLTKYPAHCGFLLAYVRAFIATGNKNLWNIIKDMAKGNDLGKFDESVNLSTKCDSPYAVYSALELYNNTSNEEYLKLAEIIGKNIINNYFHHGYFTKGKEYQYAKFDCIEPLALLAIEAAKVGKYEQMPTFLDGGGYVNGHYQVLDGSMLSTSDSYIYFSK